MAGRQGRCLPAVGQEVTAPDGGMQPSAGRRVAAACRNGRPARPAAAYAAGAAGWRQGKTSVQVFRLSTGSESESLSSVLFALWALTLSSIAHAVTRSQAAGAVVFMEAQLFFRPSWGTPWCLSLCQPSHYMPSCTFQRPFSATER
jgi:hypothetical protein